MKSLRPLAVALLRSRSIIRLQQSIEALSDFWRFTLACEKATSAMVIIQTIQAT
jgi:hypothetical protein